MDEEERIMVELMFPSSVWGQVIVKNVDDGSPYTHAFFFHDIDKNEDSDS